MKRITVWIFSNESNVFQEKLMSFARLSERLSGKSSTSLNVFQEKQWFLQHCGHSTNLKLDLPLSESDGGGLLLKIC